MHLKFPVWETSIAYTIESSRLGNFNCICNWNFPNGKFQLHMQLKFPVIFQWYCHYSHHFVSSSGSCWDHLTVRVRSWGNIGVHMWLVWDRVCHTITVVVVCGVWFGYAWVVTHTHRLARCVGYCDIILAYDVFVTVIWQLCVYDWPTHGRYMTHVRSLSDHHISITRRYIAIYELEPTSFLHGTYMIRIYGAYTTRTCHMYATHVYMTHVGPACVSYKYTWYCIYVVTCILAI